MVAVVTLALLVAVQAQSNVFGRCPCENGGKCLGGNGNIFVEDEILTEKHEQCLCATGWRGYLCQEDEDECRCAHMRMHILPIESVKRSCPFRRSNPCAHGTCQDALGISEYHCSCDGGFSGQNCDLNTDECASFPCAHGASCIDGANSFECVCAAGWGGGQSLPKATSARACCLFGTLSKILTGGDTFAETCVETARLNPIWRDVRGAYVVDPENNLVLNPVSKAYVGIGTCHFDICLRQ